MAIGYRVAQIENREAVFSGDGGLYVAGRWNYKGRKVVYCSESISLCTLEWLSHNGLSVSGFCYYRFSINIPNDWIVQYNISDLPKEWNFTPALDKTRDFAEKMLFSNPKYLAMKLPSVVIPEEYNYIINTLHQSYPDVLKSIIDLGQYSAPHRAN